MKTEDIDAAIDKLENNMAHTSMTLNEEKKHLLSVDHVDVENVRLHFNLFQRNSPV